ncbi:6-phosphogluconate dehydrogenase [Agromyces flavus]|uniref:6-phosphogluconate dehydrogenase n=1 Tax=Agromyces flavus TaxID=589382 RepID=A0A1H1WWC6_9MICO|nr:decarboxylating 6-phosphogluconate dehydrogenase [Agromyces flavus]MCP2366266.1 6-phosphogluconate dehydrogenase [Agromyces flavus]GGI44330.1 6-phosphogluconate dehydrogenase [Agromyces flavus]SDT00990.1 6-phosphogluconate dehydrogenase (decarboxylating) [Agromyces flavus]
MQLGMVGLGRMGANIVRRLMRDGHECVVFDVNPDAVAALVAEGATGADSIEDLAAKLDAPRAVWLMVPAGITGQLVDQVAATLEAGDTIIDGGNSNYRDDVRRAAKLKPRGIHYVDAGTSGGVFGLERGYCLMIGGPDEAFTRLEPIFRTIAPGEGTIERTPGRTGDYAPEELGYLHCGPSGAGHFVKMVHNGIEYGIMAALAEGMNILENADAGTREAEHSAEVAPLEEPEFYQFTIDTPKVTELWRRGSVISSWLLDLTAAALQENPALDGLAGRVSDSGEGRWTVKAAVDIGVPAPVLAASLFERFASRDEDEYANQLLSAMRLQFGGHRELPAGDVLEAGTRKADA